MTQSALRVHGGKSYLAKRIIGLLPPRDTWHLWREPFFGGGAVTLAMDHEGLSEAVNDLNCDITNFWRVLQTPSTFFQFYCRIANTPFSEHEWMDAMSDDGAWVDRCVTSACTFFIRCRQSRQGLMRDFSTPTRRVRRGMNENVSAWLSAVEGLPEVHARLKRIEIRNMDACEFIEKYDDPQAVFYCDPPYLHETRSTGGGEYRHEMTTDDHVQLLDCLGEIKGRFLLSGYHSGLYDATAKASNWNRVDIQIDNKASGRKSKELKTECVWRNY